MAADLVDSCDVVRSLVDGALDVETQPSGLLGKSSEYFAATVAHNSYWKSRHVAAILGAGSAAAALPAAMTAALGEGSS